MEPMIENQIEEGSGNIFEDLGLPDADELMLRAQFMLQVIETIKGLRLKQRETAQLLGIDQSKVSQLMNLKLSRFSLETLIEFMTQLGYSVEIRIKKPRGNKADAKLFPYKPSHQKAAG